MSVENHRHCQKTVLSAYGIDGRGKTWSTISSLSGILQNLPSNWIQYFTSNGSNITQDFASILRILNATSSSIDHRLTIIEGQTGQLNTNTVVCYIAPNEAYFENDSRFQPSTDSTGRKYYKLIDSTQDFAYAYGSDNKIYPGDDGNLERQYDASEEDKRKYPLFTLNAALQYLRRFRANGAIQYKILTQYGTYDYGTNSYDVKLTDAVGGSTLYIGPEQTKGQTSRLNCMSSNYTGFNLNGAFNDSDVVNVIFKWNDIDNSSSYGLKRIQFHYSNTIVDGIGFQLERKRDSYAKATYLFICVQSGSVKFSQCVFRNVQIAPSGAESPSPTITMSYKYGKQFEHSSESGYVLDNLNQYMLPNVFVDDPTGPAIDVSYLSASTSDNTVISNDKSYVVFKVMRNANLVNIGPSDAFRWLATWDVLGKWVVNYEIAPDYDYRIINNDSMSGVRWGTTSVPNGAKNDTIPEQTRIEIRSSGSLPSWFTGPGHIFKNVSAGYDSTHGSFNEFVSILTNTKNTGCVKWNGNDV